MSAREPRTAACDGSSECAADVHIHGCFADDGNCDEPDEWHVGRVAERIIAEHGETLRRLAEDGD